MNISGLNIKQSKLLIMKNDLTEFEKDIIKYLNSTRDTKLTHKNLMEWNSSKSTIESNSQEGEKIFKALGVYVAIPE